MIFIFMQTTFVVVAASHSLSFEFKANWLEPANAGQQGVESGDDGVGKIFINPDIYLVISKI